MLYLLFLLEDPFNLKRRKIIQVRLIHTGMDLHFTAMKIINDKTLMINYRNYLLYLIVILCGYFCEQKYIFSPILTFYHAIMNRIQCHISDTLFIISKLKTICLSCYIIQTNIKIKTMKRYIYTCARFGILFQINEFFFNLDHCLHDEFHFIFPIFIAHILHRK